MRATNQNILIFLACFTVFQICYCTNDNMNKERPVVGRHSRSNIDEEIEIGHGCECKSDKTGEIHNFCYVDPQNKASYGKKFDCSNLEHLENFGIFDLSQGFVDTSKPTRAHSNIMFVSACSDEHFQNNPRCSVTLSTLRKFYPNQKMILYDLGMNSTNREIAEKIGYLEIRKFDFSKFPNYTAEVNQYRWKVLMTAEVLKEYSNVWWMDAGTTVVEGNFMEIVYQERADQKVESDIVLMDYSSHSNFATLDPTVLTYFPTKSEALLKSRKFGLQYGTNIFYIAKTRQSLKILKWLLLCALDEKCMNPPTSELSCQFGANRFDYFANCFRFDQSILNLLLLNKFQDHNKYASSVGLHIDRIYRK